MGVRGRAYRHALGAWDHTRSFLARRSQPLDDDELPLRNSEDGPAPEASSLYKDPWWDDWSVECLAALEVIAEVAAPFSSSARCARPALWTLVQGSGIASAAAGASGAASELRPPQRQRWSPARCSPTVELRALGVEPQPTWFADVAGQAAAHDPRSGAFLLPPALLSTELDPGSAADGSCY